MIKRVSFFLFLFALSCPVAWGQTAERSSPPADEYRLGKGDLIQISVFGIEQFDYEVRIGSAGEITLPYVGDVTAAGLTAAELSDRLASLMDGKLFKDPEVTVVVKEHRANPIIVLGAVSRPGTYQIDTGSLSLIDLIAKFGGISSAAGEHLIVQRHHSPDDPEPELIKINLKDLLNNGIAALNIPLEGGDIVSVPPRETQPAGVFYVIGEVLSPGIFDLPPDRTVLVTQAIASAGGPARTAKLSKGILVRYLEDGTQEQMAINFKKMLKGASPDIEIQAQDIIFIPGSNIKTIGYGLLGVIPGSVQQATTRGIRP